MGYPANEKNRYRNSSVCKTTCWLHTDGFRERGFCLLGTTSWTYSIIFTSDASKRDTIDRATDGHATPWLSGGGLTSASRHEHLKFKPCLYMTTAHKVFFPLCLTNMDTGVYELWSTIYRTILPLRIAGNLFCPHTIVRPVPQSERRRW